MSEFGADFYRDRAAEMRKLADDAQTEASRKSFLLLEGNWLRLAEQAEKARQGAAQGLPDRADDTA